MKTLDVITRSGEREPKTFFFQSTEESENRDYAKGMAKKGFVPCFWRHKHGWVVMSWEKPEECKRVGNYSCRGFEMWTHKSAAVDVRPQVVNSYEDSIANFLPEGA